MTILTLDEVAARIGLQPQSLRSRIHKKQIGSLPIFRTGDGPKARWVCYQSALEAWIESRTGQKGVAS